MTVMDDSEWSIKRLFVMYTSSALYEVWKQPGRQSPFIHMKVAF